jgi:hypothetical protein
LHWKEELWRAMKKLTRLQGTRNRLHPTLRSSALPGERTSDNTVFVAAGEGEFRAWNSRLSHKYFTGLCTVIAGIASLTGIHARADEPDYNAPWPKAEKHGSWPPPEKINAQGQPPTSVTNSTEAVSTTTAPATPVPTAPATPAPTAPAVETSQNPTPTPLFDTTPVLHPAKPAKNEISASGDFSLGQGTVSVPFGFSVKQTLPGANVPVQVIGAKRTSVYYGGTLSYSYGQAWYLDFSYLQGQQTAPTPVTVTHTINGPLRTSFEINDDWYQVYARYTFPSLRGKKFSAYARAGFTYVSATLTANGINAGYRQTDDTSDMLGNAGFGVAYNIFNRGRLRLYLQGEGEGFGGIRSQDSLEVLTADSGKAKTAHIDNTIFGGIGRATARLEYRLGRSGLFKLFADGGFQGQFSEVSYPSTGSQSEDLWGPYVKIGARYSF